MPTKLRARARFAGTGLPPGNPAEPGDIQLGNCRSLLKRMRRESILGMKLPAPRERPGRQQRSTRTLTGKDELLTIGIMLLLTMLVIAAALTPALTRPRPVPLMPRTRDRRR